MNVFDKLTNNIVIDGSNNGINSRNLTIRNFGGVATAGTNTRLINIVGNAQNVTIKNVTIEQWSNTTSAHAINIQGRGTTAISAPLRFRVERFAFPLPPQPRASSRRPFHHLSLNLHP